MVAKYHQFRTSIAVLQNRELESSHISAPASQPWADLFLSRSRLALLSQA
jgi:hypothetical protein